MKTLVMAVVALVVSLGAVAQPVPATRADLVVSPAWLAAHLKDAGLVVLQVGEKKTYDTEHVPGARFVNVSADLAVNNPAGNGLTLEMLTPDVLRDRLAALGIGDGSRVVVVESDDWWSPSTRLVLTLDYAGLKRTAWLDGGLAAWKAAGQPTTAEVPAVTPGKLSPLDVKPLVVDSTFVAEHAHSPGFAIVDARATAFYDGSQPGGQRGGPQKAGHIPGALSAPFSEFVTADSRLKSPEEITAVFDKAGVKSGDTIVGYCHIGQQATAMLFAARTVGHRVLLYDGSFQDWVVRDLPVENPAVKK
jgi:thiosulfate/3-mercaptopyruvate sulfurtransferase